MGRPRKKQQQKFEPKARRNHQITAKEVRLIDDEGNNVGVVPLSEALKKAEEKGFDLIEISAKANPPVTRIMDYGKYTYQQEKKDREARKKQTATNITKGVRFGLQTSEHDLETKTKEVDKFLKKGYKVRVEVLMRGREKAMQHMAEEKIKEFLGHLKEEHTMEQEPKRHPKGLFFVIKKS